MVMNLGPKSQNNEFVEEWVGKLGFSWSNNEPDRFGDKKMNNGQL